MPTYEYACTECGRHLEVAQSFSDEALTTCPHCGGPLRKVFGSIGIVLKGSGFYRTDSRAAAAKSDGRGQKDTAKSSEGGDSKGDTKTGNAESASSAESGGSKTSTSGDGAGKGGGAGSSQAQSAATQASG